jgi:dsRNA-specific ribonuclease
MSLPADNTNQIPSTSSSSSAAANSLNLFSSIGAIGLLDSTSSSNPSVGVNQTSNDISSSFSQLNNENIAQMINQAQLLHLNEDVSNVAIAAAVINMQSALSSQIINPMSNNNNNNKQNKLNNYNGNFNNDNFNNNNKQQRSQNQFQFKNVKPTPQMNLNQNFLMNNTNPANYPPPPPPLLIQQQQQMFAGGNFNLQHNLPYCLQNNITPPPMHQHQHQHHPTQSAPPPLSYLYNTNSFNNKTNYLNYRSYIQAKRAENMHKLWPHSVKSRTNSKLSTSNNNNKNNKSEDNVNPQCENKSESSDKTPETPPPPQSSDTKTPMCLINELVKFNKIKHEYVLLDEIGPAHKKKFFVSLKLGIGLGSESEESFTANSTSIKKAQHSAAEIALKQTKFKRPVARTTEQSHRDRKNNATTTAALTTLNENVTSDPTSLKNYIKSNQESYRKRTNPAMAPTVLLNSLAMKLGLVANYTHVLSSAISNNIELDVAALSSSQPIIENNKIEQETPEKVAQTPEQQNISFTSDLNQSCDMKSSNYTNFMNNDYQPFKYPSQADSSNPTPSSPTPTPTPTPTTTPTSTPSQIKVLVNPNKDLFLNNNNTLNSSSSTMTAKGFSRIKKKFDQNQNQKQYFFAKLNFAQVEFSGEGLSLQLAKHDAASKALNYFSRAENFLKAKELSLSTQNKNVKAYRPPQFYKQQDESVKSKSSELDSVVKSDCEQSAKQAATNDSNSAKSKIMLVHEYAYRLKKSVSFQLISESGPSHIKKFVTKCSIGKKPENSNLVESNGTTQTTPETPKTNDEIKIEPPAPPPPTPSQNEYESCYFEALGEGNSKKLSKNNSAIEILKVLKEKFEPLFMISSKKALRPESAKKDAAAAAAAAVAVAATNPTTTTATDSNNNNYIKKENSSKNRKNKAKNIVKNKKTNPDYGKGSINPISRLIQIQQAKKQPEPQFVLIVQNKKKNEPSNGHSSRIEFTIQVTVVTTTSPNEAHPETSLVNLQCEGKGSTKKLAKQRAAEEMLNKLGYQSKVILKPSIKSSQIKAANATIVPASVAAAAAAAPGDLATDNVLSTDSSTQSNSPTNIDANSKSNGEKRVTFLEENITIEIDEYKEKKQKELSKKPQTPQNHHNEKLKLIKQQLKLNSNSEESSNTFDKKSLELVYKVATELLESINSKKECDKDKAEFYSPTAEMILKENGADNKSTSTEQDDLNAYTDQESEEKKLQFKILNGGNNDINYKKALDYLGTVMKFKINYQSLLGRDGNVCSYVNLTALPETDKPLNGQGLTHIESSNAAALCALQYLSSKLQKN